MRLPEDENFDIRSSINALVNIVKNDYTVYSNSKAYIVDMFATEDPREKMEFVAQCEYYGNDSYGVRGSEFNCCKCKDNKICKYAGSEFKTGIEPILTQAK